MPRIVSLVSDSLLPSLHRRLQGDNSACSKPPVDIDLRVKFLEKILILKVAHFEIVPYHWYTGTTIGTSIVPVQKLVQ